VRTLALTAGLLLVLAAPAPAATVTHAGRAAWRVEVTGPSQSDFTLVRAEFRLSRHVVFPHVALLGASPGQSGLDAVIAGRARSRSRRRLVAYLLAVNRRPAGSLAPDLASVPVTLIGRRLGRAPALDERANAFAASGTARPSRMCRDGAPTFVIRAQGGPAFGYPPDQALVQALDAACGRPVDPAFVAAVAPQPQPSPPPPPCPPCDPRMERPCPEIPCAQP
jgi:hypothetical protein